MQFIGLDIGSSAVKGSIIDGGTGRCLASATHPKGSFEISSPKKGWAEQDPDWWWASVQTIIRKLLSNTDVKKERIAGIGIAYQMHGLVAVDQDLRAVRPSIIWCDSRAVETGDKAFNETGREKCLSNLLNSPGNFTASKLKWVKDNEPKTFERIHKVMLPGDYIAMRLSGIPSTTVSGLSEGIMWDFQNHSLAGFLLSNMGLSEELIPSTVPTFSDDLKINQAIAEELGLPSGIPISYRAGDQPNNAFSLSVLKPGEVAATAGTSGVIYGVSDAIKYDPKSRVNTFAHVNYSKEQPLLGILLCVNGTGILNSWVNKFISKDVVSFEEMNSVASTVPIGSDGLTILPFGNGAERMLENKDLGSSIHNLNFNSHSDAHLFRASQEGIAFAFNYGLKIMKGTGISPAVIRAGRANMFLSDVFAQTLSNITNTCIQLYNTDGALGAARGAALGAKFYKTDKDCFENLTVLKTIEPKPEVLDETKKAYQRWHDKLIYGLTNEQ